MIQNTEIPYKYGGDPSIPNLNYYDMYFYATGGVPNKPRFNALPKEVQRNIIENMKRFGGPQMGYYQGDMGPSTVMPDDYQMYGPGPDMGGMDMGESYMESMNPMYVPPSVTGMPSGPLPANAVQAYRAAIAAPQPVGPQMALKAYQGPSVVDFLNTQGVASDYATRKQLAQVIGITNYRGTPAQNGQLIQAIINNPDLINVAVTKKAGRKANNFVFVDRTGRGYTQQELDDIDARLRADAQRAIDSGSGKPTVKNVQDSGKVKPPTAVPDSSKTATSTVGGVNKEENNALALKALAGVVGLGAVTYFVNALGESWAVQNAEYIKNLSRAGLSAQDIVKEAKLMGRGANTVTQLVNRGMKYQDALKALKGIKFSSSTAPKIASAAEVATDAGSRVKRIYDATKAANLDKAKRLAMVMRDAGRIRDPKIMAQIEKLVPNVAERMSLLKGLKFPSPSTAVKGTKLLRTIGKLFDEGGSYMPMYQGPDGGSTVESDAAGLEQYTRQPQWYDIENESTSGITNNLLELADPFAVSSWDDMIRSWEDPEASWFDKTLETLSVIPAFGKIGKGTKLLKNAALVKKAPAVGKAAKARKIVGKAFDWGTGAAPARILHSTPFTPTWALAQGVSRVAGPRTSNVLNILGNVSRGNRASNLMYGKAMPNAQMQAQAQKILNEQPEERIKFFLDDGSLVEMGSRDPEFLRLYEMGAINPSDSFYNSELGATYLDTTKGGPIDWQAFRKKYPVKSKKKGGAVGGDGYTYSAGVFYLDGGTFLPMYGDSAYGALPEYGMGSDYMNMYQGDMGPSTVVGPEQGLDIMGQMAGAIPAISSLQRLGKLSAKQAEAYMNERVRKMMENDMQNQRKRKMTQFVPAFPYTPNIMMIEKLNQLYKHQGDQGAGTVGRKPKSYIPLGEVLNNVPETNVVGDDLSISNALRRLYLNPGSLDNWVNQGLRLNPITQAARSIATPIGRVAALFDDGNRQYMNRMDSTYNAQKQALIKAGAPFADGGSYADGMGMAHGGLVQYQTIGEVLNTRAASDNTRTMARQNADVISDVRNNRGMKKEYIEGLVPRYTNLKPSSGNFNDLPSSYDSFDYKHSFNKAPLYNLIPHEGSYYDYTYYPTELDYKKALANKASLDFMMEGKPALENIASNETQAYQDWQNQFRNKYYDANGNIKKEYSKLTKIMNIPKKLPKQATGGNININPANKGKFTAKANRAGMGVQEYARKVMSAPEGRYPAATRRQANFAKNAAGWKKQDGGIAVGQEMYVTPEEMEALRQQGYEFDIM